MSKRTHRKQLDRARERRVTARDRQRRRTRAVATLLILVLGAGAFAAAVALRDDAGIDIAEDPAVTPTDAVSPQAAGEACPAPTDAPTSAATPYDAPPPMTLDPTLEYVATIHTTCGTIVAELAAGQTPNTVNNFVFLAAEDYYVGSPFHRVIDGFMIQGGDPTGTGHGGQGEFPGYRFEDELALAEQIVADEGGYPRGVLAMANAGPDTQGSQFFIVQSESPYPLPAQYTIFGRVVEGLDVVDRIAAGPTGGPNGDLAAEPAIITDVTIETRPTTTEEGS